MRNCGVSPSFGDAAVHWTQLIQRNPAHRRISRLKRGRRHILPRYRYRCRLPTICSSAPRAGYPGLQRWTQPNLTGASIAWWQFCQILNVDARGMDGFLLVGAIPSCLIPGQAVEVHCALMNDS